MLFELNTLVLMASIPGQPV